MEIVLASSSKQRQDIFKMIGLKYEVMTSDVDEISNKKDPGEYVKELSLNKAKSVAERLNTKKIIIGADTIIYANGRKYEKPKNKEEALNNLKELSGKKNTCYTGLAVIDLYQNKIISVYSTLDVYFKDISDVEMKWYVENEAKIFKCCGYVPLGKASIFIDRVDGDYNTIIGISPRVLFDKLGELGYNVTDFDYE